ncbi:MAG TPA: O-antigen ligase family protein [Gemmatimonadales bacterium]|nr:O-antigen ligase family protein [Gemmatimonadales bacterium]
MSRAAFSLLWCFVFILPWDKFIVLPVLGSLPRIVGLVASAVGVLYILARRRVRPLAWFHVFALLFVIWAGVSAFWSFDPQATRVAFLTYLQLLVLVWLIWEIAWTPERQRALLQAYVLGVSVAALVTIYRYLTNVPLVDDATRLTDAMRFTAFSYNVNELGMTLALGLPMAWYLSLSQPERRRGAWMWRLYLPLGVTGILLTASRGAFLSALVALLIIPWTLGRMRLRTRVALYALATGTLLLATHFVPESSFERLATIRADVQSGYFGGRGAIWTAGLEVAEEHPFVGVGTAAYGAAVEPTLFFDWGSHSVPLAILVENGLVGLFLFIAAVAAAARPAGRLPPLQQRFSIILLLTLVVGSLSGEWQDRKQFWFVLGILAAEVAYRPAGNRSRQQVLGDASDEPQLRAL